MYYLTPLICLVIVALSNVSAFAQNVYVDFNIRKYTDHISKYTKSEMEAKLKDTLLTRPKRYSFKNFAKPKLIFDPSIPHDYILQINVGDTTIEESLSTDIILNLYKRNFVSDLINPKQSRMIVSYSGGNGLLSIEKAVLNNYFGWIPILADVELKLIPYHNTFPLQAFNLPKDSISKFESFREFVIGFDYPFKIESDSLVEQLFKDVLHKEQEFYWAIRSQRTGFFNVYEKQEEAFTNNPFQILFSVLRSGDNYTIRLIVDKNIALLKTSMFEVPEQIEFTHNELLRGELQIIEKINKILALFFRLNLD